MNKKIFVFLLIMLFGIVFIKPVKANTTNLTITLKLNNQTETITVVEKHLLIINYRSDSKEIIIRDNQDLNITRKITTGSNNEITFSSSKKADVATRDAIGGYSGYDISLNNVSLQFGLKSFINVNGVAHEQLEDFDVIISYNMKLLIEGNNHAIVNNIDSPYTIAEIKEVIDLVAYDEYDGFLTNQIEVKDDNYTTNKNKVGQFKIVFFVKNSSDKSVEFTLNVINKDLTAPTINGPANLSFNYREEIKIEDILSEYTVTDNYSTNLGLELESGYNFVNTVGTHSLVIFAKDEAGNRTTKTILVKITDDVPPKFDDENEGSITINYKDQISDEILKLGLTANDDIDGDITSYIVVISNNIKKEVGSYTVVYEVIDKAGNKTTYSRTYNVISQDIPAFYISNNVLTIEDINNMTIEQLIDLLALVSNIEVDSYEVLVNEYEGNESIVGNYKLSVKIIDKEGNSHIIDRNINVFERSKESNNNHVIYFGITVSLLIIGTAVIIFKKRK